MSSIKSLDALNKSISANTGKSLLINGDFSAEAVINQRGFDGNWAGATEGAYGFDRWKKSGTDIVQIVEAGGYKPSIVHTLSGIGLIPSQITSPASGNWTITVANTATEVQLELGDTATDFEVVSPADQLARCQRYFVALGNHAGSIHTHYRFATGKFDAGNDLTCIVDFMKDMRTDPVITSTGNLIAECSAGAIAVTAVAQSNGGLRATTATGPNNEIGNLYANTDTSARIFFDSEL